MITNNGKGNEALCNLPRKINIALSPSRDDFPHTHINDVGLQAGKDPETGEVSVSPEEVTVWSSWSGVWEWVVMVWPVQQVGQLRSSCCSGAGAGLQAGGISTTGNLNCIKPDRACLLRN